MKARFYFTLLLLCIAVPSFSQEVAEPTSVTLHQFLPFQKSFSLEIGMGFPPIQVLSLPSRSEEEALAQKGQEVTGKTGHYPSLTVSGVCRVREKTELLLTACAARCHYELEHHPSFWIDPNGNPRYNLEEAVSLGRMKSDLGFSMTFQYRHIFNPDRSVEFYYGFSLGLTDSVDYHVLPGWTPLGLRGGGDHFYIYVESTLGPVATLVHGGLGWRF